jgi:hypothetical protein
MTCVWDSIIQSLTHEERNFIFENRPHNANSLAIWMKINNRPTENVLWNKAKLHENQIKEGVKWIDEINPNNVGNGYDCSVCDPLLLLLAELLKIKIEHVYMGNVMFYEHKTCIRRTVTYTNDRGHFSYTGTK